MQQLGRTEPLILLTRHPLYSSLPRSRIRHKIANRIRTEKVPFSVIVVRGLAAPWRSGREKRVPFDAGDFQLEQRSCKILSSHGQLVLNFRERIPSPVCIQMYLMVSATLFCLHTHHRIIFSLKFCDMTPPHRLGKVKQNVQKTCPPLAKERITKRRELKLNRANHDEISKGERTPSKQVPSHSAS